MQDVGHGGARLRGGRIRQPRADPLGFQTESARTEQRCGAVAEAVGSGTVGPMAGNALEFAHEHLAGIGSLGDGCREGDSLRGDGECGPRRKDGEQPKKPMSESHVPPADAMEDGWIHGMMGELMGMRWWI
jgi:hypothetical protein